MGQPANKEVAYHTHNKLNNCAPSNTDQGKRAYVMGETTSIDELCFFYGGQIALESRVVTF
jgi:hypothetical protein